MPPNSLQKILKAIALECHIGRNIARKRTTEARKYRVQGQGHPRNLGLQVGFCPQINL